MKRILFLILAICAMALTACSSTSITNALPTTAKTSNGLSAELQIAVGTLKLKDTDQDITAAQAKELLVYWYVYQDLSQSDTAAQEEIDGLVAQIQETMTSDQMQAITAMKLTQQDVFAATQGSTVTSSSPTSSSMSSTSNAGGDALPDGGMGAPMDGGGDMSGGAPAVSSGQTMPSMDTSSGVPSALVEQIIKFLQEKIAA
jgi:hypothetical protein